MDLLKRGRIAGILILTAYGVLVSSLTSIPWIVMSADVLSGLSVLGIALMLYPLVRMKDKMLSRSYLVIRSLEGLLMVVAGIFYLIPSLRESRDWIYNNLHIYTFILGALAFYLLLLRNRTVPPFLSIWGLAATGALIARTLLQWFNLQFLWVDALLILIITNEIVLSVWLIFKGFAPLGLSQPPSASE